MKAFMDDDFLLQTETAKRLYRDYAAAMPIIDYHCHLSQQEIYENRRYDNLTEVWLYGDHYKWRAMRANGVEEKYITGGEGVGDYDRFLAYARTVPMTLGNPLYHWSHLELRRLFGIDELINERNAPVIWEKANAKLRGGGFSVQDLIRGAGVEVICTTDDPADSLEHHVLLAAQAPELGFRVLPSFRPDKALEINRPAFLGYLEKLGEAAGRKLSSYDDLLHALESRARYFHAVGGRVSDHALDYVPWAETTHEEAALIYEKALSGDGVTPEEERKYKTYTLLFLGRLYAELGWAMQYHINAHRNNNARRFAELGPDTGFDSIGDGAVAAPLARLLDRLDEHDRLPRTILYSINPTDNDVLAALIGSFQGGGIPGKIQLGSAWWFNDTKDGMLAQLRSLGNMGLLPRFVGMLTDSRSFLSYTRHEYFRRIFCNLVGEWVEQGEAPDDPELLRELVQGVSYANAKTYFGF
ncbi:glucuronate isomerase [Paenibacillus sp. MWE-103]|uniref:Uronate isomerase n=1 Tax=Paenibacillus artemisiicola TaxID=1172618 RepID=A0ABS3WKJ7_9BACL|nr:glucuronate isomerase [Paenibacillus artemisiicola]MBO7748846.1 glucuronate isomerase [Paenibacillus artemisiicola]